MSWTCSVSSEHYVNVLPFRGKESISRGDRFLNDAFPGGQQYGGDAHVIASASRYYCDGHGVPISTDGIWATRSVGDGRGGSRKGQNLTGFWEARSHVQSKSKCLLAKCECFTSAFLVCEAATLWCPDMRCVCVCFYVCEWICTYGTFEYIFLSLSISAILGNKYHTTCSACAIHISCCTSELLWKDWSCLN